MRIKYNIDWLIRKTVQKNDPNRIVENIFDYQNIIRKRPDLDREIYGSNGFYGMNYILKRYSGYDKRIKCLIEHAPGFTNIGLNEYKSNIFDTLLVSSEQRKKFLESRTNKRIYDIGPSIAYAETIYDEYNLKKTKNNLGKTLLLFPIHNIKDTDWQADTEGFIKKAKELARDNGFDTVLVSLYYVDIMRGLNIRYEKEGFTVVSAGNIDNYDFNDCMKTIISLSDFALYQGFTSSVGYCIYMNVPVCMVWNDYNTEAYRNNNMADALNEFQSYFIDYDESISEKQREICNHYYGYDSVRTPDKLYKIFDGLKRNKPGRD